MKRYLFLLAIAAMPARTFAIDAEGIGGGDLVSRKLENAYGSLTRSLNLVRFGYDKESLCAPVNCDSGQDKELCGVVSSFTQDQRKECRKYGNYFAQKMAKKLFHEPAQWGVSSKPLLVKSRAVAAMTQIGSEGAIVFSHQAISEASDAKVIALFAHELGHKISSMENQPMTDEAKPNRFKSGKEFLDAFGAALALYATSHAAPQQDAPALPTEISVTSYCSRLSDDSSALMAGLSADLYRELISKEKMASWKAKLDKLKQVSGSTANTRFVQEILAEGDTREREVQLAFRKLMAREAATDEVSLLTGAIAKGLTWDTVFAGLIGSDDYAKSRQASADIDFISQAYLDVMGRAPTGAEIQQGKQDLEQKNRSAFVVALYEENPEAKKMLVKEWYKQYLNRTPSAQENALALDRLKKGVSWDGERAQLLARPEYAMLQVMRWQYCK